MSLSPDLETGRRSISHDSSSECTIQVEYKPYYGEFSVTESKPLPLLPLSDKFDPYLVEHPSSYPGAQFSIPPLTTILQLAYALGPDNVPHTTEIDTVPCAGIRIPHGPLTGLMAWRLVVRLPPSTKEERRWWNDDTLRKNSSVPMVQIHTQAYTEASIPSHPYASMSALSLPLFPYVLSPGAGSHSARPSSVILTKEPHFLKIRSQGINRSQPQLDQLLPSLSNALIVNFILDTSLPYSIISRDTLIALGYSPSIFHVANMPHDDKPAMVTLSIQNIPTRFCIARPNEASRLGVQFLHDAGVSVFFPKDGEAVGPVLYVESARLLKDVPCTISIQGIRTKCTLSQRVRALLRLS